MAGALLTLWALACSLGEVTAAAGGDVLVVEGHLQAGSQRQAVLLHRSLQDGAARREDDASVRITGPGGTVTLSAAPLPVCALLPRFDVENPVIVEASCYATDSAGSLRVVPGETYELEIVTARGERVRGRTTVPGDFVGRRPSLPASTDEPVCHLPAQTNLELVWTQSQGAWSYLATLEVLGLGSALEGEGIEAPERIELTGLSISQSDTTLVLPAEFGLFELVNIGQELLVYLQGGFPYGVTARLRLAAVDRNYVNAIRGGAFNPSGAIRVSSVVGDGVGVFGSFVARDLVVIVGEGAWLPRC